MIDSEFLTQALTIPNHPVCEYDDFTRRNYVIALGEFLCFITHSDYKAKQIFTFWANSIYPIKGIDVWMVTSDFTYFKKCLSVKKDDKRHNELRICFIFDCFYLAEKANSDYLEKAYILLSRKVTGYFTKESLNHVYGFMSGENNGDKIHKTLRDHRQLDLRQQHESAKRILVVATMTAGKSTLINALVGNKINKVSSRVCTNKIRLVYNKLADEGLTLECCGQRYIYTENYKTAQHDSVINVGVHFRSTLSKERLCIIDTPGENFHGDPSHGQMTRDAISSNDYDILLFISNATQNGTLDEARLMEFAIKKCRKQIIFCLNKCDQFKPEDDSIEEMVNMYKTDIIKLGHNNPDIVVVSALWALLLKMAENGYPLTDEEEMDCSFMKRKLRHSFYHLEKYNSNNLSELNVSDTLKHTGLLNLESILYEKGNY